MWRIICWLCNDSHMYGGLFPTSDDDSDFEKIKRDIFLMQISHINQYHKSAKHRNETFVIGDIRGSLAAAFIPLIEAGIIEEGSIEFDEQHDKFICKLTHSDNSNKVICCGNVLNGDGNTYEFYLLDFLLNLSNIHHDKFILVLGNREIQFLCTNESNISYYDAWIQSRFNLHRRVHEKLYEYFMYYSDALAYVFDSYDKSFVCSHACLNDESFLDFSDCLKDGRLDVTLAHTKLCEIMQKERNIEVIFDKLFYSPKLDVDENGNVSLTDRVRQYYTKYPTVEWFVGHIPVQKVEPGNRSVKIDDNMTIYFMNANTPMNFHGNEDFKYGESLYIAKINIIPWLPVYKVRADNIKFDNITFDEKVLTYNKIKVLLRNREDVVRRLIMDRERRSQEYELIREEYKRRGYEWEEYEHRRKEFEELRRKEIKEQEERDQQENARRNDELIWKEYERRRQEDEHRFQGHEERIKQVRAEREHIRQVHELMRQEDELRRQEHELRRQEHGSQERDRIRQERDRIRQERERIRQELERRKKEHEEQK